MNQPCSVGLIGCGKRARKHMLGLRGDPRVRIVGIADVNLNIAETFAKDYALSAPLYADYQQMLAREKPDLVVTCLWTPMHLPVFEACVNSGVKAVHSEKPMAPTWGQCLTMGQLAADTKTQLTFSHQRRYCKGNRYARQLIAQGTLGKILRMDLFAPPNLLDCGTHSFDQALSYNNETPAKWVLGAVDTTILLNWFDVQAEIRAVGTVLFSNNVVAQFHFAQDEKELINGVRVIGEDGFIEVGWDGEFHRAFLYKDPAWRPDVPRDSEEEVMTAMIGNIIDCIGTNIEPENSHHKALRTSEILFALYESVRSRRRIYLPLHTRDNALLSMIQNGDITTASTP